MRHAEGDPVGCPPGGIRESWKEDFYILADRLTWKNDEPELGGICLVAGLGPEENRRRDGSFDYYISEPVVSNDAKGVAPFVLCYTEMLQAENHM